MNLPVRRLDPKILALWWVTGGIFTSVLTLAGGVVAGLDLLNPSPRYLPLVPAAISGVFAAVLPLLRYRRWRYELRERDLFVSRGAISIEITAIPFDRMQFSETNQGPLDRMFGLAKLVVYTAAGKAGTIPGLNEQEASELRDELSRVAGHTSV